MKKNVTSLFLMLYIIILKHNVIQNVQWLILIINNQQENKKILLNNGVNKEYLTVKNIWCWHEL